MLRIILKVDFVNRGISTFCQSVTIAEKRALCAYGGAAQAPAKPDEGGNRFNDSCIPWARFTAFHLHLQKGYRHLPPLFTVGRFAEAGGRTAVPLAVQVHHAVCDGRHVSLLVADVQRFCAELAARLA